MALETQLLDITSANASLVLTAEEILPSGVALQCFSTDQSFSQSETTVVEDRMGVDGSLAAGWIPAIKTVQVSLEAGSPSTVYLDMLARAMENNKRIYACTLVATVPSIRKIYTWTKGVLKTGTLVNSGKKVLDPTQWSFDFATFTITQY